MVDQDGQHQAHARWREQEFGRQLTDNFRNTGYFNNATTSIQVPFANPMTTFP